MKTTAKIAITRFDTGVHSFWKADPELPFGIAPSVNKSWKETVTDGYFA
jgi:hypothetical protein